VVRTRYGDRMRCSSQSDGQRARRPKALRARKKRPSSPDGGLLLHIPASSPQPHRGGRSAWSRSITCSAA